MHANSQPHTVRCYELASGLVFEYHHFATLQAAQGFIRTLLAVNTPRVWNANTGNFDKPIEAYVQVSDVNRQHMYCYQPNRPGSSAHGMTITGDTEYNAKPYTLELNPTVGGPVVYTENPDMGGNHEHDASIDYRDHSGTVFLGLTL